MSLCLRTLPLSFQRAILQASLRNAVLEVKLLHSSTRQYPVVNPLWKQRESWPEHSIIRQVTTQPSKEQILLAQQLLNQRHKKKKKLRDIILSTVSLLIFMGGVSMATVPLYKIFCSATGYGGTTKKHSDEDSKKVGAMEAVPWRPVTVTFGTNVHPSLDWEFTPVQDSVTLVPGETCLAFFTAKNTSSSVITGISTYNVTPYEAGNYFNKIQCFCFDEQTLNPGEELDMPVFFYIDPEFALDADLIKMKCNDVQLHYTFFNTDQPTSRHIGKNIKEFFVGSETETPEFIIPNEENIVKINEQVYKEVIRKGYQKEFVAPGGTVVAHVTGTFSDSGKIFWSTKGGTPFTFKPGVGTLVTGWEEGCLGMSEGEISKIHMSSSKGYGKIGNRSWNIPGHTNISFELEIMAVR